MAKRRSPKFALAISPRALEEIRLIAAHVAKDSPLNAQRLVDRIEREIDALDRMPRRHGTAAEARRYRRDLRQAIVWPYRIVFEVLDGEVQVHLVRHGARLASRDLEFE